MITLLNCLSDLFFPDCCLLCNTRLLPSEEGVCLQCLHALPRTENYKEPGNQAETLLAGRFPFVRVATFCIYSSGGVLQPLIHQLKYDGKREIGTLLGRLFGKSVEVIYPFHRSYCACTPAPRKREAQGVQSGGSDCPGVVRNHHDSSIHRKPGTLHLQSHANPSYKNGALGERERDLRPARSLPLCRKTSPAG